MPRATSVDPDTSLRRSARNTGKKTYVESDSEGEEEEGYDNDNDESDEEDYTSKSRLRSKKSGGPQRKRAKRAGGSRARAGSVSATGGGAGVPPEDFVENYLYESLSSPEISIQELSLEWLEAFEQDQTQAITTLANLVLRCCGCYHLLQAHDLANLESAAETIGEVQIAFELQRSHEFPFISNNKDLKFFKKNVIEFFEELVDLSHEKGLLYKEGDVQDDEADEEEEDSLSSALMTQILTWFASMSTTTTRPLRYVSTVILLTIQSKLCHVIVSLISNQERSQRQLANSKKSATTKKMQTITNTIKTYHTQIETINEYFNDIIETVFIHRYRDLDPLIRQECIKHLGEWMGIYPELFFQSSNLRYFGWLLSDPSNHVRNEVVKVLLKLYKHNSSGDGELSVGFRQFTERFKRQMINMSWNDQDNNVKLNLVSCLIELQKIGFLDELEIIEVSLEFYSLTANNGGTNKTKSVKHELAKFISQVNIDEYNAGLEKFSLYLNSLDEDKAEPLKWFLKIRYLINFLKKSSDHSDKKTHGNSIGGTAEIYEYLYQIPSFLKSWSFVIKYFLFDFTRIDGEGSDLQQLLETGSDSDKYYLLSFLLGSLSFKRKNPIPATGGGDDESYESILLKLSNDIATIQQILIRSDELAKVYMKLWNLLLDEGEKQQGFYSTLKNLDQMNLFNDLVEKLLKYYQNYELKVENDELLISFNDMFSKVLSNYQNSGNADNDDNTIVISSETRLTIQDLITTIVAECKHTLGNIFASEVDQFQSGGVIIFLNLVKVLTPIFKLNQIGEYINLNQFPEVGELLVVLISKLNQLDLNGYLIDTPTNFLENLSKLVGTFKGILDFILTLYSWKLETLMAVPLTLQGNYDLSDIFNSLSSILKLQEKILRSTTSIKLNMRSKINDSINILQTLFSAKLTDFLVSMKVFYIKFSSSNQFRNFHILNDIGINLFVKKVEPSIELDLLDVFLYKEATLAGMLGIDLDRNDEENVNLGNFGNEDEVEESNTLDDSRFEEDIAGDEESRNKIKELRLNEKKKQEIWKAEKDLCVFVMKMFTLINLSMVENDFKKRVGLNKEKIGGLFERVVKQNQIELQTRPISGLQEVEVIQSESVDVDKGEAVDVPTTNDVGIEDSFILN